MSTKKAFLVILVLVLCQLLCAESFDIVRADFDISVSEGGLLSVIENLTLDYHEASHGFYRDIPLDGADIDIISVSEDWQESRWADSHSSYVSLRIGSPDVLVEGVHDYTIVYNLQLPRDRADGFDEVYIDLWTTGDYTVDNIIFSLAFPSDIDPNRVWATTGAYGSTTPVETVVDEGRIVKGHLKHLGPDSGLSLRVELPDGYFAFRDWTVPAFVTALAVTVGLIALLGFLYNKYGRDSEPVSVVTFNPPHDLSPLEVGYLFDSSDDSRDYVAMLYYWADKGLLTIEEGEDGSFTLHKKSDLDSSAPDYEAALFQAFFRKGDDVALEETNIYSDVVDKVSPRLRLHFEKGGCALYDRKASRVRVLAFAITALYAALMAACSAINDLSYGLFSLMCLGFQFLLCFLCFWTLTRKIPSRTQYVVSYSLATFITLASATLQAGISTSAGLTGLQVRMMALVVATGLTVLSALSTFMSRRSPYAQQVLGEILGYRDFLEKVEVDKLRTMIDEDPDYFYHNLSYAIVLDLEEKWARKAEDCVLRPASWYSGPVDIASFYFYHRLYHSMNDSFVSHCYVPPQGRGVGSFGGHSPGSFGSSGFSGGGIGGGGARSW